MWIKIILITLGCIFLLHEVNSKYVVKEEPYEKFPIGEKSHRDTKRRKTEEYYNDKYLHYTKEPYFDYFDYADEYEYAPKHVHKHSKHDKHHKHANYYEEPYVDYFPKAKESKKDKKIQEIIPEKKLHSKELHITDPYVAKYDKKEYHYDPYMEYDYYEPRYEKKHHSKDRYVDIRHDKYDPRYDYDLAYDYYDDILPNDKHIIHSHKHDHKATLQIEEPHFDKIVESKHDHHHFVENPIDPIEHLQHFDLLKSTVANIENMEHIQNFEPLYNIELDQMETLPQIVEPPILDDVIEEEIITVHEHPHHLHHHSAEHHIDHEIIPHVHHSHYISHHNSHENILPSIPQYIEEPIQNEQYKNALQNIIMRNLTENIRFPINLSQLNMMNLSHFAQSLLPLYNEPQLQNVANPIPVTEPIKKAELDDNPNKLFSMDEGRLSRMFGPEPVNEWSEWDQEIDERTQGPNFKHLTASHFCRRWWWIPRCKCFFRWIKYCWPRWTHPMCWCSTYCGWK